MKTFVDSGSQMTYTNSTGSTKTAGSVVVMGSNGDAVLGILVNDVLDTESGPAHITGKHKLAKVSAAVIAAGEAVIWDNSESAFEDNAHTADAGDVSNGAFASSGALAGTTEVEVILNPGNGVLA